MVPNEKRFFGIVDPECHLTIRSLLWPIIGCLTDATVVHFRTGARQACGFHSKVELQSLRRHNSLFPHSPPRTNEEITVELPTPLKQKNQGHRVNRHESARYGRPLLFLRPPMPRREPLRYQRTCLLCGRCCRALVLPKLLHKYCQTRTIWMGSSLSSQIDVSFAIRPGQALLRALAQGSQEGIAGSQSRALKDPLAASRAVHYCPSILPSFRRSWLRCLAFSRPFP
jgi:hypothetical protein